MLAATTGEDGGGSGVYFSSGCAETEPLDFERLKDVALAHDGIAMRHRGLGGVVNHYHIRFGGS